MKLYGEIDLHSNNSLVALLDEEERLVYRTRLANDATGILDTLAPCRGAVGLPIPGAVGPLPGADKRCHCPPEIGHGRNRPLVEPGAPPASTTVDTGRILTGCTG